MQGAARCVPAMRRPGASAQADARREAPKEADFTRAASSA